jgi:hypothetical protein
MEHLTLGISKAGIFTEDQLMKDVKTQLANTPPPTKVKKYREKRTTEICETLGNFRKVKSLIMGEL